MRMLLVTKRTIKQSKRNRIGNQKFTARMLKKFGQRMYPKLSLMRNPKTHKERTIKKLIARGILEPLEN